MRRTAVRIAVMALVLLLAALLVLWVLRFRLATAFVEARLAKTGVPVSYRLTRIDPFLERIENVRIGDPKSPDLIADRIEVRMGYGLHGPIVREVRAVGVDLRGRLGREGLDLGALNRLLPHSTGGGAVLPDLRVTLGNVRLALATPNGAIALRLEGSGNPQHRFVGKARAQAETARIASCAVGGATADLALEVSGGRPHVWGPLAVRRILCPGVSLGSGVAALDLHADSRFQELTAQARLSGFGGSAGPVRLASLSGPVKAAGRLGALNIKARLAFAGLSANELARNVALSQDLLAGTPLGPTMARASSAVAALLSEADGTADLVATIRGPKIALGLRRATLTGTKDSFVRVSDRGGTGWSVGGWRTDLSVASGGDLPAVSLTVRQAAPGAAFEGAGILVPYNAGAARVSADRLRFRSDGRVWSFSTTATIDGPIATGFVNRLVLPIRGTADSHGRFVLGSGCQPLEVEALRIGSFTFGAMKTTLCGTPLLTNTAGRIAIRATTGPVALVGRIGGATPVDVRARGLRVRDKHVVAQEVTTAIGSGTTPTRIAATSLEVELAGQPSGTFMGATATVGSVPIGVVEAAGRWGFERGALDLAGRIVAKDLAAAPRFRQLQAEDARLRLVDNRIVATAALHTRTDQASIVDVDINHDLSTGAGRALLDATGIVFTPKGLQPDMLTPLTLGVVANVAGTVAGKGHIDWTSQGASSTGTFGTEGIDFAAAFGPVKGLRGKIDFVDLLGLVSAPDQRATVAEINPGVAIADGVIRYSLPGENRVRVDSAVWPFAGGTLRLEPTTLDLAADAERRLTFRIAGLDAAAFVQQLDFPNIAATGTFDGLLPMAFGHSGGRVTQGFLEARQPGGTLAYVGDLSNAQLGTMGKLAFDALKAIRYSALDIRLDGALDGEMVSRVRFTGVREATAERNLVARMIRNLPFRFNIAIRAPFRGLVGSARSYADPSLLLQRAGPPIVAAGVQPAASEPVR